MLRPGLSISLNYRCSVNPDTSLTSAMYHKFLVLLGWRPSIATILRKMLLTKLDPASSTMLPSLVENFRNLPSSCCYVTLCDGVSAALIEKDLYSAHVTTSDDFIVNTNHDITMEDWSDKEWKEYVVRNGGSTANDTMEMILLDSKDRKRQVQAMYQNAVKCRKSTKYSLRRSKNSGISQETVIRWISTWPIKNECTHFGCIMDPKLGEIVWIRWYPETPTGED
jgi:hypothetical protein